MGWVITMPSDITAIAEKPVTPEERHIIPGDIIRALEKELYGIRHGSVTLTVRIRDGHRQFVVGRERSIVFADKFPKPGEGMEIRNNGQ
jgi:hypothetical protein